MGKMFIKGPVEVKIVMELTAGTDKKISSTPTSFTDINGTSYSFDTSTIGETGGGNGSLIDITDMTYAVITEKGSVAIDNFGLEHDTFDTLENYYSHDIDIREIGGGSCEFVASYSTDTNSTKVPVEYLIFAAAKIPNGLNYDAAATKWSPESDTATTKGDDARGYAILVQQHITGSTYAKWTFHNCKISFTPTFASKKATRGTLKWEDARYIDFSVGSAVTEHTD